MPFIKKTIFITISILFIIKVINAQSLSSYEQYIYGIIKKDYTIVSAINSDYGYRLEDAIESKESPAQTLFKYGHYYFFYSVLKGSKSCTETMLDLGISIDYKDSKQKNITALNIAVEKKDKNIAKTLINKKINLSNAFNYAKYHGGENHMEKLSDYIYDADPNKLKIILNKNPAFIHSLYEENYPNVKHLNNRNLELLISVSKKHERGYLDALCTSIYNFDPNKIDDILIENPLYIHYLYERYYPDIKKLTAKNVDLLFLESKKQGQDYSDKLCNKIYSNNPNKISFILKKDSAFIKVLYKNSFRGVKELNYKNLELLFKKSKELGQEYLSLLTDVVYTEDADILVLINKYYPSFYDKFGSMSINTTYDGKDINLIDTEIFVNGEKLGNNNADIDRVLVDENVIVKIKRVGYVEEKFNVPVESLQKTTVIVRLVKKLSLKQFYKETNFDWNDYYVAPVRFKNQYRSKTKRRWMYVGLFSLGGILSGFIIPIDEELYIDYEYNTKSQERFYRCFGMGIMSLGFSGLTSIFIQNGKDLNLNIDYNTTLRNTAINKAKKEASEVMYKKNQSIMFQNNKIKEQNKANLNNRSIKYKIGDGDFIYIVEPN